MRDRGAGRGSGQARRRTRGIDVYGCSDGRVDPVSYGDDAKSRSGVQADCCRFDQMPALIAYASHASQVAPLIQCARRSRVKPVPRAGGHQ